MSSLDKYRVKPDSKFNLEDFNPRDKSERSESKEKDQQEFARLAEELDVMQDLFYADGRHRLLLVLQGMDTSGKDGVIRHVFGSCDPLGLRVASFKAPTPEELAHDYLWRVHGQVPKSGEIAIFNRSHYEDVLIVRVHEWIDEKECERRYKQINGFERMLAETGTTIIKCFLHISKDEQKKRLEERLGDPTKTWKFNPGDLKERELWPAYMKAYERALAETSTDHAPWYVVPADSKTNRNLLISRLLLQTMKDLKLAYPPVPPEYKTIKIKSLDPP